MQLRRNVHSFNTMSKLLISPKYIYQGIAYDHVELNTLSDKAMNI